MKIRFHKNFIKHFKKLPPNVKEKAQLAIQKFCKDPLDPYLKNHALSGKLKDKRAFSVTSNIRIIFEEFDNYVLVIMLDVGTHNQVYN